MSNLKKILYNISEELDKRAKRTTNIMAICIQEKLDISLNNYLIKLEATVAELKQRNALNLLKKMTKEFKN